MFVANPQARACRRVKVFASLNPMGVLAGRGLHESHEHTHPLDVPVVIMSRASFGTQAHAVCRLGRVRRAAPPSEALEQLVSPERLQELKSKVPVPRLD